MKQNLKQTARKRLAAMALFLLICLPFSLAQAQTIKVNGRVTDDLNEPMIGVSILRKALPTVSLRIWTATTLCL